MVMLWAGSACTTAPQTRPKTTAAVDAAIPADEPHFGRDFWAHWGDGNAELAGYELTFPRYGAPRTGVAVTIFVTETFANSARVKSDPGNRPPSDEFPVMKLNLVHDFQTGIYDYNEMASRFVALAPVNGRPAGALSKVSFSSQEWCGHVYQQALFDETSIRVTLHSYFDGEADQERMLEYPANGMAEDALHHWARGLAWPALAPGESRSAPLLPSLQRSRHQHQNLAWTTATLARSAAAEEVTTPAGNFIVERFSARIEGGREWTFHVEQAEPHRIVRWESSDGERADLLGAARLPYWKMNGPGFEDELKKLGLAPRVSRMP